MDASRCVDDDALEHQDAPPAGAVRVGNEAQPRAVRLVSESARVNDPVRVTFAGDEIERRIAIEPSCQLHLEVTQPPSGAA